MPVLMMLFLMLACIPDMEKWPPPAGWLASPVLCIGLTWLGVLLEILFALLITRWTKRSLANSRRSRDDVLRGYLRGRWYHTVGLFLTFALGLYVFRYGGAIHALWSRDGNSLSGAELLLLAPFFASLISSWACFYGAERAFWEDSAGPDGPPRQFFSRRAFVWFHLRQNLALVFLPVIFLVLVKEAFRLFPALSDSWQTQAGIGGSLLLLGVLLSMPWIIRILLDLHPLPDGPLRQRLVGAARRLRFRFTDILVWNTRSGIANAMVVGVIPYLRYVILTDRLMEELGADEVEAVFGHEIGHVKHHHMLYYLSFLLTSWAVLGLALEPWQDHLVTFLHLETHLAMLPAIIGLGLYMFLVFGFLSRRCERQADIYGCRAVSCGDALCGGHPEEQPLPENTRVLCTTGILTFIQALEKVALLNGISRDRPGFLQSWQHSTIARRVDFLKRVLVDPQTESHFQRRVFLVKCGLFAVLAVILLAQIVWPAAAG